MIVSKKFDFILKDENIVKTLWIPLVGGIIYLLNLYFLEQNYHLNGRKISASGF
jgi:hypothetical protein